ncbi:MAG: tripartite tricarboxylate transporter permease, partial [Chloroflexi bacterium]|nr:tripartite tricarboxylate transporter permease [Chloroflexota bacterium]
ALIMLAGIYYGSMYGGSTTSILVNVPGEAASVVTAVDGYQMAQRGRAGAALAIAGIGSFIAGTIGVVGLMVFAPTIAQMALAFGPPEYFAIALLGLFALSRATGGSLWRCLFVVAIGLGLATVGMDQVTGSSRFTFGQVALMQGFDLVPVVVGLFGMAEVLVVAERAGGLPRVTGVRLRELFPNAIEWQRSWPAILRGTGVGFLIGLIPGPAAIISSFASYNLERRLSKRPEEFGQGAIEGVAGPEAANNAASSAQMVPLLALGIPFGPATAVLLAALVLQGVQPGPLLMQNRPEIFWGVVTSMYVGNFALLVLNLPLVGMWVSLLRIPQAPLLAGILMFMLVGSYSVNNSMLDLIVVIVMGVVGYVLRKLDFDLSPLILAVVLGPFLETTFRQSLNMSRGDLLIFVERPLSAAFILALVVILVAPTVWRIVTGRRAPALPATADD